MKRKRGESHIQWLPVELFYHCLSWVPIRDVIISRRVSGEWRTRIDSWKERFRTLSIMYDGPACFDPMNCPFKKDSMLTRDSLSSLRNPPFSLHAQRVLIGDALFHKVGFDMFCESADMNDARIASVCLRTSLISQRDQTRLRVFVTELVRVIGEVSLDMSAMDDYSAYIYSIRTVSQLARSRKDKKIRMRLYLKDYNEKDPERHHMLHSHQESVSSMMRDIADNSILEGFGWQVCQSERGSKLWREKINTAPYTRSLVIYICGSYDRYFVGLVEESQLVLSLDTLSLKIRYMNAELEYRIRRLIDACPNLRNAVLDVQAEFYIPFPWVILEHLARKVTSLRFITRNFLVESNLETGGLDQLKSFKRVELVGIELYRPGWQLSHLLKSMPNVESVSMRLEEGDFVWDTRYVPAWFGRIDVESICKRCRARYILFNGVELGDAMNVYGYKTEEYHGGAVLLTRI